MYIPQQGFSEIFLKNQATLRNKIILAEKNIFFSKELKLSNCPRIKTERRGKGDFMKNRQTFRFYKNLQYP